MKNELTRADFLPGSRSTAMSDGRFDILRSVLDELPVLSSLTDASRNGTPEASAMGTA
jgi:hypothetical protein